MAYRSKATNIPFPKSPLYLSSSLTDALELVPSYNTYMEDKFPPEGRYVNFGTIAATIESENLEVLKHILLNKTEIIQLKDPITQTTILHVAAKHPNPRLWTLLILHTCFNLLINQGDIRNTTPLIAASYYNNAIAAKMLLEKGADTGASILDTHKTALHLSAELDNDEICSLILKYNKRKSYVNQVDWEGYTPLMLSVIACSPTWKILLLENVDFKRTNIFNRRNILHLGVAYNNYEVISFLINNILDTDFFNLKDINFHSPLHLALLISDEMVFEAFLESIYSSALLQECQASLHFLVEENKIHVLEVLSRYHKEPSYYDICDTKGRTLLMVAVELRRKTILQILIGLQVNFKKKNYVTGETVLHVAVYSNDTEILDLILEIKGIEQIIDERDYSDVSAFELVLRKAGYHIWSRFMRSGWISRYFKNNLHETTLFIAAKEGNYIMLLILLLSPRLHKYLEETQGSISEKEVRKMETKGILYPSDIYITLGVDFGQRGFAANPPQGFLFQPNSIGQNIFHACAMGESLQCLSFIHDYCSKFNVGDPCIHESDTFGNTPLLLAIHSGNVEVAEFFLKQGCDVSHKNKFGWSPLTKIGVDDALREMYNKVINHSFYTDHSEKKIGEMVLNFSAFCPLYCPQMRVVSEIFKSLKGPENLYILSNPIIEYFVVYRWIKIRKIIAMRFLLNGLMTAFLSTYLTLKYCEFLKIDDIFLLLIRWTTIVLSILIILFNSITSILTKKIKLIIVLLIGPVLSLIYFFAENESRFMLEIGAVSVLVSWICLFIQGHVTKLSFQISMFVSVLNEIIKYLPICIVVILAFSLCFFTIFHDYFPYNNPLHSFISTSLYLREGDVEFPMFPRSETMLPIHKGQEVIESVDPKVVNMKVTKEIRNLLIEGSLIVIFEVLVSICVFNMMVGLAVRSGEEMENEGKIHRTRIYTEHVTLWEQFINTSAFRAFRKWRILWLIGLPQNLEQKLSMPLQIKPLQFPLDEFDLNSLKYPKDEISDEIKMESLKDILEGEKSFVKQRIVLRKGSIAATNLAFVIHLPKNNL